MVEITLHRHIAAPPGRVFEIATDFDGAPGIVRGIERVEVLTPGPVGAGTRFRETRRVFKREATEEMEVAGFDPPRRYALACDSHGSYFLTTFTLEPAGDGTDLRVVFAVRPRTTMAKILGFLFRPMIKACARQMEADLDDLAAAAEAGAGRPAVE